MSASHAALRTTFEIEGIHIPAVGFGTFQTGDGDQSVKDVVARALQSGYTFIDTAASYGNETEVGAAIKESGVDRKQLFITTKLPHTFHKPEDVEKSLDKSLEALQVSYVDLFLMHFPHAYTTDENHNTLHHPNGKPIIDHKLSRAYTDTWAAMEKLVGTKTRLIGVSNFNILKLKKLLAVAKIKPAVNQVELHPYLPQTELLKLCRDNGIHVTAHQPLGGRPLAAFNPNLNRPGPLVDLDIQEIANKNQKTPAQVLLSWAVLRGTSVVPKTVQPARMIENRDLFQLSDEEMRQIDSIVARKGSVRYLDPKDYLGFDCFNEDADEPVGNPSDA